MNIETTQTPQDIIEVLTLATNGSPEIYTEEFRNRMAKVTPYPTGLINLDLSTFCNLRCKMCIIYNRYHETDVSRRFMSRELFAQIADDARAFAPQTPIGMTSLGELTCNPNIMDIFKETGKRGLPIVFITNGILLTPERSKALLAMGLRGVSISHDAVTPQTYKAIRGVDKYYTVVENTWEIIRAANRLHKANQPNITLNFVLMEENSAEMDAFLDFWGPLASKLGVQKLRDQKTWSISYKDNEPFTSTKRYPCIYPWRDMWISSGGDVYPCCIDFMATSGLGNVNEQSLGDIWLGERFNRMREKQLALDFREFPVCAECEHWNQRILKRIYCTSRGTLFLMTETYCEYTFEYLGRDIGGEFDREKFDADIKSLLGADRCV